MSSASTAAIAAGNRADHLASPGLFVWYYVRERRIEFGALLMLVMFAAASAVAMQYQMKRLVDAMAFDAKSASAVWTALTLFVLLMAAESGLLRVSAWLMCRATIGVGVKMRLDLFAYLGGQSIRYFAEQLAGGLGQRITSTAGNFGALANTAAWRIVPPIVDYLGALLIFTLINWRIALTLGLYVAGATVALIIAGHKGRRLHTAYSAHASSVAGRLIDVISNMWAVKAFQAQGREARRLQADFNEEAEAQQRSWMYTEKTRIVYDFAVWLMAAMVSVWAVRAWSLHEISPGDVVIITALTFRILHGSRDVALALVDVSLQLGYIEDTLQVIGGIHSIVDSPAAVTRSPGLGRIQFKDVCFGYDPTARVLSGVNIDIGAGEKVGIVGSSGAGKTTIIQLIQRLHDPQSGMITIDGTSIGNLTQDSLRAALAVVPQEIFLLHRSIMDNIRFGRPEASEEEIYAAARAAQCEEFILRLPQGYDTIVGDRGVKLSGGQRQRVSIARAFLKNAPILILDEATSALDTSLELRIQRSITNLLKDRTVISVAHRLSTLTSYDRILVIDHGEIVEEGRPADLRSRGPLFRAMWRSQAEGIALVQ
jgi:ATP-binding cassette subfamily B protein